MPGIDDGAKDIDESIKILEMMKEQGITDVIATPHFYPNQDSLQYYLHTVSSAFKKLSEEIKDKNLPNIYLGTEILYYRYLGKSESAKHFCLNSSDYLLLELTNNCIGEELFEDISELRHNLGITPIIAHIERYFKAPGYKKLLNFIKNENIPSQINASSFFSNHYAKPLKKLIKGGYVNFIATDSHSADTRPPMLKEALELINTRYGSEYLSQFVSNSQVLFEKVISK